MRINKQDFIRGSLKLLFELIIVFFGVLLAFLASDWSIKKSQKQRFDKALTVLHQELTDFVEYSPGPIEAMEYSLQQFKIKHQSGEFPDFKMRQRSFIMAKN